MVSRFGETAVLPSLRGLAENRRQMCRQPYLPTILCNNAIAFIPVKEERPQAERTVAPPRLINPSLRLQRPPSGGLFVGAYLCFTGLLRLKSGHAFSWASERLGLLPHTWPE